MCGDTSNAPCQFVSMTTSDKNGGPNHLKAWRDFRGMTQQELADAVKSSAHMIGYLETGERGLSAKWLRKLAGPLRTTPGHLLEHDPNELPTDIVDIWINASADQRKQLVKVATALVEKTG